MCKTIKNEVFLPLFGGAFYLSGTFCLAAIATAVNRTPQLKLSTAFASLRRGRKQSHALPSLTAWARSHKCSRPLLFSHPSCVRPGLQARPHPGVPLPQWAGGLREGWQGGRRGQILPEDGTGPWLRQPGGCAMLPGADAAIKSWMGFCLASLIRVNLLSN